MLRRITKAHIKILSAKGAGFFGEYGFIGNKKNEGVIINGRVGYFLADYNDFEHTEEGVKPKSSLLLAIGGLPPVAEERLARQLDVSIACAKDIIYLRNTNRWTQDLEDELIELYDDGTPPNMTEFGVTPETQSIAYTLSNVKCG